MTIAYSMASGKGDTDLLLYKLSERLAAEGRRICGTVQINTERECTGPCDMDVKVLPDGPVVRISQNLGAGARGCRLDPAALEDAVAAAEARFGEGIDLVLVNKFGKHEADGRGFRQLIADAIAADIPVLVGVNEMNREAFLAFCGDFAEPVAPSEDKVYDWCRDQLSVCADGEW